MTKLEKIKEEIELVWKGIEYVNGLPEKYKDNPTKAEKLTVEFMPRLSEKMKLLGSMVHELEQETGKKFDWSNPDNIYDIGEQMQIIGGAIR